LRLQGRHLLHQQAAQQAHAMLAVHNLSRLQELASSLARLLRA
jgi:hypothetical protein